jgi:niacin transporter
MTAAALLIAVGIVIPMVSPVKIVIEPMSFTLASHVAIFIAMFISPMAGIAVAAGTTLGFFIAGFPLVVVLRAASHLIFTTLGALYLKARPQTLGSVGASQCFSLVVGLIHAAAEVAVVFLFYFYHADQTVAQNFMTVRVLLGLVGLGTIVHSMVDFAIAYIVYQALIRQRNLRRLFLTPPETA